MFNRTRRTASSTAKKTINYGKKVISYEELSKNGNFIKDLFLKLLPKKNQQVREETFANAYQRKNMDEEQLALSYKYYAMRFYIFALFASLDTALLLHFGFDGQFLMAWLCFVFLLVCLSLCFQASFRALQIERRELFDVHYWLQNPGAWIPNWALSQQQPIKTGKQMKPSSQSRKDISSTSRKRGDRK